MQPEFGDMAIDFTISFYSYSRVLDKLANHEIKKEIEEGDSDENNTFSGKVFDFIRNDPDPPRGGRV